MLLFSFLLKPFTIKINYIRDSMGNITAVSIPIEVWNTIKDRYKDLAEAEEYTTLCDDSSLLQQPKE